MVHSGVFLSNGPHEIDVEFRTLVQSGVEPLVPFNTSKVSKGMPKEVDHSARMAKQMLDYFLCPS